METVNLVDDTMQQQLLQQNSGANEEQLEGINTSIPAQKKKMKHVSAFYAAALCRSAVQHAHLHTISNRAGDFAHSATNISYNI